MSTSTWDATSLTTRFDEVRSHTERLAAPLSPEDQTVQSMPDVSAPRSGTGRTSPGSSRPSCCAEHEPGYRAVPRPTYGFLFNCYYEAVGDAALPARAGPDDPARRRTRSATTGGNVDERDARPARPASTTAPCRARLDLIELGLHHEQQHQELMLMDIKHVLSRNPLRAGLPRGAPHARRRARRRSAGSTSRAAWSRSATRATGFALRQRGSRATERGSSPSGSPTAWSPTASGSSSWTTAATSGPSSGSSDGWATGQRRGLARAALLGRATTATSGSSTPCTAPGRSIPARAGRAT